RNMNSKSIQYNRTAMPGDQARRLARAEAESPKPSFQMEHLSRPVWAAAIVLGAVASAVLAHWLPVYFRMDDAAYMAWAAEYAYWWQAFDPRVGVLHGMFRPMVNLWWQLLWAAFEFEPIGYQVVLTFAYALALIVWLDAIVRWSNSGMYGMVTIGLWLLLFFRLQYVVFWFSSSVYVLSVLFIMGAFHGAVRWRRGSRFAVVQVVVFHLLAMLTRESSALILPAVYTSFYMQNEHDSAFRRLFPVLGFVSLAGIFWVLIKPGLAARIGAPENGRQLLGFVTERWQFYGDFLSAGAGLLLWILLALLLTRESRGRTPVIRAILWFAAAVTLAGAVTARSFPTSGWLGIVTGCVAVALFSRKGRLGALWFVLPVVMVTLIEFKIRTYMLEASFGAAMLAGVAFTPLAQRSWDLLYRWLQQKRMMVLLSLVGVLIVAGLVATGPLTQRWEAARTVSENRVQFSRMVRILRDHPRVLIVVVDYEDRGLDYVEDILPLDDLTKARVQKPMTSHWLNLFLRINDPAPTPRGVNWNAWREKYGMQTPALVLAMNPVEIEFLEAKDVQLIVLHEETGRYNQSILYRAAIRGPASP
ncbi:MAG: hypothetical protein JXN60_08250, partial [Lentisphaerae bacterium]|nr:hypothetical protein [Lentisphaerota bacterium]